MQRHRKRLRVLVAVALVSLSVLYIQRAISESLHQLGAYQYSLSIPDIAILLAGTLGTLVISTLYHVVAVRRVENHRARDMRVALAYALGQVMRYVPGKVFGIVFQVNYLAGQVRGTSIGMALLVQTFYDYAWTFILVACLLAAAKYSSAWPLIGIAPALALVWVVHRQGWLERTLARPALLRRFLGEQDIAGMGRPAHAMRATALVGAVWLPMLLGTGLGLSGLVGLESAVVLGALYIAAAVVSLLVFVVPSGLVVREALFVWLGAQYGLEPTTLVLVGLLLRLFLTLSEVLNLALFVVTDRYSRSKMIPPTSIGARHDP